MTPTQHPRFAALVSTLMSALNAEENAGYTPEHYREQAERVIGDLLNPEMAMTPFVMSYINPRPQLMRAALLYHTLHFDHALSMDTTMLIGELEATRNRLLTTKRPPFVCPECGATLRITRKYWQTSTVDSQTGQLVQAEPIFMDDSEVQCSAAGFEHEQAIQRMLNLNAIGATNHALRVCPVDGHPLQDTGVVGLVHADTVWEAEMTRYRCAATENHLVFVADADTTAAIDEAEEASADQSLAVQHDRVNVAGNHDASEIEVKADASRHYGVSHLRRQ